MRLVSRLCDLLKTPRGPLARIVHMSAAFAASDLMRGVIGLATSVVIARGLGRDEFGRWTLCAAWTAALTMTFDLGFGPLLTREAARDEDHIGSLLSSALLTRVVFFLPVGVFLYAYPAGIRIDWMPGGALHAVVTTVAAGVAYGCLAATYRASPSRLLVILTIETLGVAVRCAAMVFLVARGTTLVALLRVTALVQIAQLVAAVAVWQIIASDGRLERPSPRLAWAALRRAFPFALTGLVSNAQARLAPVMLGYLSGAGEIAFYGVASRIGKGMQMLPLTSLAAAMPVFSRELRSGSLPSSRSRFDMLLRWYAGALALILVVFATPIVRLTYGSAFVPAAGPLAWIGIGLIPLLANNVRKMHFYASGQERAALQWSAVALLLQTVGCAVLIPHFGAVGAAIALALGEAAVWLPLRLHDFASPSARSPDGVSAFGGTVADRAEVRDYGEGASI